VRERRQQAVADRIVVRGQRPELPVTAAKIAQEHGEVVEVVDARHDADQRVYQVSALRLHRHREHRPSLRMLEEQIGVEMQRYLVAVHGDAGKAALEAGDVQRAAPSG
jgi:hypothetical protein